ncbi:MAG: TrkH family potassium uptake protein [Alphaproteobacteria bacterium]|nr:potassium transporter TrkH [Alphaproteobacteria bacterium]MCS5597563.1 TrkH family potassium uptake protein [Alphaproteobacteria bacterium]|tara:strand:- start:4523 stop:5968 length:1446 start_codon:yes stop_codon:yes gene_type:complete
MDFRPILYVIGLLLFILAISMNVPMLVDLYFGNDDWVVFFICIIVTAFFGGALAFTNAPSDGFKINIRQGFMLTVFSWISLCIFAAIPFWLSGMDVSFVDAVFEATSGITTTGSTIMVGLDYAPPGILMWRAILQWLGGIGIIVMALSVLPFLKVGGMQLFKAESFEVEKVSPRATQIATAIAVIYVLFTILCALCYKVVGMTAFDAVAHALTTISTGGFSTYDTSFAHYEDPHEEIVAIIFMLLGGMPFILYFQMVTGRPLSLFRDSQVRWYLSILFITIVTVAAFLVVNMDMTISHALRRASFNAVSLMTGTGFASGNYNNWGGFVGAVFFFLMVVGGCAGSTSCGIKVFRFQILFSISLSQLKKLIHPNGVFRAHYNRRSISEDVMTSVMSFFFLYALSFSLLCVALSFTGLDFLTAMSGAASSISNVGPGLGEIIGPAGNYSTLPDSSKWILTAGMIVGRLEIFTLLVLFLPHFWRK